MASATRMGAPGTSPRRPSHPTRRLPPSSNVPPTVLAGGAATRRRMVELTPDDARRATRALALAEGELLAGHLSAARYVVDRAPPRLDDDHLRGVAMRLNGAILFAGGLAAEAADGLVSAARVLRT